MIYVDRENVKIKGNNLTLICEITGIVRDFYQKGIIDDKDLDELVELAKMSDKELKERSKIAKENILKELDVFGELLNEAIKAAKEMENENEGDA